MAEYRIIVTVYSSHKDYAPINFTAAIPEELAKLLMMTPVGSISIGVELKGQTLDKSKLLDFK